MSIFVEDRVKEHPEEGEFTFSEPTQGDVLKIPKIFNSSLSELQEKAGEDGESVDLEGNVDDINFDLMHDLLSNLIVDWPADEEINAENISSLKISVLSWCMEQAFDIINDSQVTEDEEKN